MVASHKTQLATYAVVGSVRHAEYSTALVAMLLLSGCLDQQQRAEEAPGAPDEPLDKWHYDAAGTLLPLPSDVQETTVILTGERGLTRGEPSIGMLDDGTVFTNAWDLTLRSLDRGETWAVVQDFDLGLPLTSASLTRSGDPYLWVDRDDGRVYVDHLYGGCNTLLWSEDAGDTWTRRDLACTSPFVDHQKLASGPPGVSDNPFVTSTTERVIYLCYSKVASSNCAMSYDRGMTWPAETVVTVAYEPEMGSVTTPAQSGTCSALNGQPVVSSEGVVALPRTMGCDGLYIHTSQDSGLSWQAATALTGVGGEGLDPDLAFDADGNLYALWQGGDHQKYLAITRDLGKTWEGPWRVSPPHLTSTEFQTIAIDGRGRIAVAFLGTTDTSEAPGHAPADTRWHLYIVTTAFAANGPDTFVAYRVTPEGDPAHVGCTVAPFTAEGYAGTFPCENLGEFIDSTMAPDGSYLVSFTDGCTEGCAGHPDATLEDSQDTQTAVAWLSPGR